MQAKSLFKITLYEGFLLVRNFVLQNSKLYLPLLHTPHKHTRVCLRERCLTSSVDIEIIFIKLFGEYIINTNEEKYLYSVRVFPNSEAQ